VLGYIGVDSDLKGDDTLVVVGVKAGNGGVIVIGVGVDVDVGVDIGVGFVDVDGSFVGSGDGVTLVDDLFGVATRLVLVG